MHFRKKINNNFAWAIDGQEHVIVTGKGISFNKKSGQELTAEDIERIFRPDQMEQDSNVIVQTFENIDADVLALTQDLTQMVQEKIANVDFNDSHFLALADHLSYALKRSG